MTEAADTDISPQDTHHKALAINLDRGIYGTLAEIGAGQEAARWFLQVGGAPPVPSRRRSPRTTWSLATRSTARSDALVRLDRIPHPTAQPAHIAFQTHRLLDPPATRTAHSLGLVRMIEQVLDRFA